MKVTLKSDPATLDFLFERLYEDAHDPEQASLVKAGCTIDQVKRGKTSVSGAGVPEIVSIILALGKAGAFTALGAMIVSIYKARPKGRIELYYDEDGSEKHLALEAENADPQEVLAKLERLLGGPTN